MLKQPRREPHGLRFRTENAKENQRGLDMESIRSWQSVLVVYVCRGIHKENQWEEPFIAVEAGARGYRPVNIRIRQRFRV